MKKIQFVGPSFSQTENLIPTTWANFRSYHQNRARFPEAWEWLPPAELPPMPYDDYVKLVDFDADVLACSFIVWNHGLVSQIAKAYKDHNPNGIVISGGPDVAYKRPDYVKENLYIDVHVPLDGEVSITKILDSIHAGESFEQHPGLVFFHEDGSHTQTGPVDLMWDWSVSPILNNKEHFQRKINEFLEVNGKAEIVWESTRGCPYSCTFCDWGGGVGQKLRQKSMDMAKAELDFLIDAGITGIQNTDANFGILKRDVDLVHYICERSQSKKNNLSMFSYTPAKNQNQRSVEIATSLKDAGLLHWHGLGLQDTDTNVLNAIKRQNISVQKQVDLALQLMNHGIPIRIDWIVGMPMQTPDNIIDSICRVWDQNLHVRLTYNPLQVLPNAEMGHEAYMRMHGLETIRRPMYANAKMKTHLSDRGDGTYDDFTTSYGDYCIKGDSFSREDWIHMMIEGEYILTAHGTGILRYLAIFARNYLGMDYSEFYKMVMRDIYQTEKPFKENYEYLRNHLAAWMDPENSNMTIELDIPEIELDYLVFRQMYHAYWLFMNKQEIISSIKRHLKARYPEHKDVIHDVCYFQNGIITDPQYDRDKGRQLHTKYDWINYFKPIYPGFEGDLQLEEMPANTFYSIKDKGSSADNNKFKPYDWNKQAPGSKFRKKIFFFRTCSYWLTDRIFRDVEYTSAITVTNSATQASV